VREGGQPAVCHREVEAFDDSADGQLRGIDRLLAGLDREKLLDSFLMMPLGHQQSAVGDADAGELVGVPAQQQGGEVLTETRVATHGGGRVGAPGDRKVFGPQGYQQVAGVGDAEGPGSGCRDLPEQGPHDEQRSFVVREFVEDL
jgi:hypothetical protein